MLNSLPVRPSSLKTISTLLWQKGEEIHDIHVTLGLVTGWNDRVGDGLGMSYKSKHSEFEYLLGVILDYFIHSFDS